MTENGGCRCRWPPPPSSNHLATAAPMWAWNCSHYERQNETQSTSVLQQRDQKADRIFFTSTSNERNGFDVKCSLSLWRSASACFIFHPFSLWAPFQCKARSSVLTNRTRGAALHTRHTRKLATTTWIAANRDTSWRSLRRRFMSVPTDVDENCLCTQLAGHTTNQRNEGALIGCTAPQWVVA